MKPLVVAIIGLAFAAVRAQPPPLDPTAASYAVAASVNDFSVDLYEAVRDTPGNLVISPLSAAAILALTWFGTGGTTQQQLGDALHLPPDRQVVANGYRRLIDDLQSDDDVTLRIANRMYLQTGFVVNDSFQQVAVDSFLAGVKEVNFENDTNNARLAINQWVENNTEGKITDLFEPGILTSYTVLVLVNALYFSAAWSNVFRETLTTTDPFYISQSQQVYVSMMHGSFRLRYGLVPYLKATAVILPYKSTIQSEMILLLPDTVDGLDYTESRLGNLNLSSIPFSVRQVSLSLPRFKIETTEQLNDKLQELGVIDLFGPQADLSGIADGNLAVSAVVQKAYIKVNEQGTEAAAATGVGISILSLPLPAVFTANHPFLFILRANDVTLFMGRVVEPIA